MDPKSTQVLATNFHSKLSLKVTISNSYNDTHNILAMTIDGDSDDSDDEDLEAYDRFAGELTAINVERTAAV